MNLSNFVNGLTTELNSIECIDRSLVYNAFENYVENKERLRKVIDLGLFHYDYAMYKQVLEGSLFEEGMSAILDLKKAASASNESETRQAFEENYPAIATGFASHTQTVWLTGDRALPERIDVFAKAAFQMIGEIIENSLKPFIIYISSIFCISRSMPITSQTLGSYVTNLCENVPILNTLYKTIFYDISISQWRNIANHGSYLCDSAGQIEVKYGIRNSITRRFNRDDILTVIGLLNALQYMHKTTYTLIFVDHKGSLPNIQKAAGTVEDDCISQIVETSFAFGLQVIDINPQCWSISTIIRSSTPSQHDLEIYTAALASFLNGEAFEVLIYNDKKMQYRIIYADRGAHIYKIHHK